MIQKKYNWYEWYWYKKPLRDEEKKKAVRKVIDIALRKGEILHLVGKWSVCENLYKETLCLAEKMGHKHLIAQTKHISGKLFMVKGFYE